MRKLLMLAAVLGIVTAARVTAQTFVVPQPDCIIIFNFTAVANSPTSPNNGLDNRTQGCTTWQISYSNSGFSALSLVLQSAPDNNGVPGTYVNFAGTILVGVNPNTTTTQAYTQFTGANPWVRVRLDSVTGSGKVSGAAYGWRIPSANNATPSGGTSNVNISQVGGVAVVSGVPIIPICTSQAAFNLSGSGDTKIITGVAAQQIHVCHISFSTNAAEDIKLTSGTGTNCGTSTADVTGLYKSVTGLALDTLGVLTAPASTDLCINQSAIQPLGGIVLYSVF